MTARRITIGKNQGRKVWFDAKRRSTHLHVIGGSGMGKSKFLEHMIREDILAGHGLCLIDPHGEIYESILSWCAVKRIDKFRRIHLIDPQLENWRTGFNPLKHYSHESPLHRVDNAIEALSHVWGGEKSTDTPAIRTVLRAIFTVLIEHRQTLAEAFPLTRLRDENALRAFLTSGVSSPLIREVWDGYQYAAAKAPREFLAEFGGPRRRLLELLHDNQVREMLGQESHAIDFHRCMDDGDIVLVNFSARALDENRARAIGAMLIRELFLVAKQRDIATAERQPFYLYIDECGQFLTSDVSSLLAQTRKFGLHAILAHQWLEQLREASPAIYAGVMAIQNKVVFGGLDDEDAALIADQLFRTEYDVEMPVEALIKPTVVRYVQTWLHHWAESETSGTVKSSGDSASSGSTSSATQFFDEDGFPVGGSTASAGDTASFGEQSSTSEVSMATRAYGKSETYLPELEDKPSAIHSLETVKHLAISRLRSLPAQHAIVKGTNLPSFDMNTYHITPAMVAPESLASFVQRIMQASPYALPADDARAVIEDRSRVVGINVADWKNPPPPQEDPEEYLG